MDHTTDGTNPNMAARSKEEFLVLAQNPDSKGIYPQGGVVIFQNYPDAGSADAEILMFEDGSFLGYECRHDTKFHYVESQVEGWDGEHVETSPGTTSALPESLQVLDREATIKTIKNSANLIEATPEQHEARDQGIRQSISEIQSFLQNGGNKESIEPISVLFSYNRDNPSEPGQLVLKCPKYQHFVEKERILSRDDSHVIDVPLVENTSDELTRENSLA